MKLLFSFCFFFLVYTFFLYPAILFVLSVLFRKTPKRQEVEPSVTLLISAYNEEAVIEKKLRNALGLDYPREKLEIIVASESTDRTNDLVKGFENQGVRLIAFDKREGKRVTLFRTVPQAKGEIVIFSDANALYERQAIRYLVRNFADERIGCVSGRLQYRASGRMAIGEGESAYWEFDFLLKQCASRLFSLAGCGGVNGSIFAVRKELYNPISPYRGDDFEISCRVELDGKGVVMEPEALSFEEPSETSRQEFNRKVRLASWNVRSCLLLLREALSKRKWLTAYLLFSHRLLRYFTPLFLIGIFFSTYLLSDEGFFFLFFLQLLFYGLAFAGFWLEREGKPIHKFFLYPFYFCMVNGAAFLGVFRGFFKETKMVWDKAR